MLRPCIAASLPSWSYTLVGTVVLMRAIIVVRPCVVTDSIPPINGHKKSPEGTDPPRAMSLAVAAKVGELPLFNCQ